MAKLPENTFTTKIEKAIEDQEILLDFGPRFPISSIGKPCARALWYQFRWCTERKVTRRLQRLFRRGSQEEPIIEEDLRAAGCEVFAQQETVLTGLGHIKGKIDGKIKKLPDAPKTVHLLESKTANDKNFKQIQKEGIEKAQPDYWGQANCYCYLSKLKRGLFVVTNKNDDSRYYERFQCDKVLAEQLLQRAMDIISTETPPVKIGGPSFWRCKFCEHYELCHYDRAPAVNCRTCRFLDIHDHGVWKCSHHKTNRSTEEQRAGCRMWEMLRSLLK